MNHCWTAINIIKGNSVTQYDSGSSVGKLNLFLCWPVRNPRSSTYHSELRNAVPIPIEGRLACSNSYVEGRVWHAYRPHDSKNCNTSNRVGIGRDERNHNKRCGDHGDGWQYTLEVERVLPATTTWPNLMEIRWQSVASCGLKDRVCCYNIIADVIENKINDVSERHIHQLINFSHQEVMAIIHRFRVAMMKHHHRASLPSNYYQPSPFH